MTVNQAESAIQQRAFNVALHARTLTVLAWLQSAQVPVPEDGNAYAAQVASENGMETFDVELVRAADPHDWVLAEMLTRLQSGDTAGMSLVDFLPPGTVLALWHAMPPERRRYLRSVFGTVAGPAPSDEPVTPQRGRNEALAMLDRLVEGSDVEISAATDLLAMLVSSSAQVDVALAEMNGTPGAAQVRAARAFTQALLDAAEDDKNLDVGAWLDEHLPPMRAMPPKPTNDEEYA